MNGQKTVILEGADLYVDANMQYADDSSVVAIVVKRDREGNGGNVYVNPQVTNLVGLYFLDGSLINGVLDSGSVTGVSYLTPGVDLNRQLLLYGSLSSSNTRGGAIYLDIDGQDGVTLDASDDGVVTLSELSGDPVVKRSDQFLTTDSSEIKGHCPVGSDEEVNKDKQYTGKYYNCRRAEAAKYDLEFFRRDFEVISDVETDLTQPDAAYVDTTCTINAGDTVSVVVDTSNGTYNHSYTDGSGNPVTNTVPRYESGTSYWSGMRQCKSVDTAQSGLRSTGDKLFRTYLEFDSRGVKSQLDILRSN